MQFSVSVAQIAQYCTVPIKIPVDTLQTGVNASAVQPVFLVATWPINYG